MLGLDTNVLVRLLIEDDAARIGWPPARLAGYFVETLRFHRSQARGYESSAVACAASGSR